MQDDHGDLEVLQVLLILEVLVGSQKDLKLACCSPQQRAVFGARPAHTHDSCYVVAG